MHSASGRAARVSTMLDEHEAQPHGRREDGVLVLVSALHFLLAYGGEQREKNSLKKKDLML